MLMESPQMNNARVQIDSAEKRKIFREEKRQGINMMLSKQDLSFPS
jgi:hypothetical protein